MKRKAGLSIEEKVLRTEAFLQETRQPFTLKELEAILPKAKGIIFQSVQECLDTLVSENRAFSDKVGVSVLFWNFKEPGDDENGNNNNTNSSSSDNNNTNNKQNSVAFLLSGNTETKLQRLEILNEKKSQLQLQLEEIKKLIAEATETCDQLQRRQEVNSQIHHLRQLKIQLSSSLQERNATVAFAPARLRKTYDALKKLINFWTDNVFLLQDLCCSHNNKNKNDDDDFSYHHHQQGSYFKMDVREFRQKFRINVENFDFV